MRTRTALVELDRRRQPRTAVDGLQGLRIHGPARVLPARVVDISPGGVGIEALAPLAVGSMVSLAGQLQGENLQMGLSGRARVVRCSGDGDGRFRIGLSCDDLHFRRHSTAGAAGVL